MRRSYIRWYSLVRRAVILISPRSVVRFHPSTPITGSKKGPRSCGGLSSILALPAFFGGARLLDHRHFPVSPAPTDNDCVGARGARGAFEAVSGHWIAANRTVLFDCAGGWNVRIFDGETHSLARLLSVGMGIKRSSCGRGRGSLLSARREQ